MARGRSAEEGATYWSQNGYHYTKRDGKFQLTHKLRVEEKLGRKLLDSERVRFIDGDRRNLDPENLKVVTKGKVTLRTQLARLIARRDELDAQIADVEAKLALHADKAKLDKLQSTDEVSVEL
jgi:hypothetical protein